MIRRAITAGIAAVVCTVAASLDAERPRPFPASAPAGGSPGQVVVARGDRLSDAVSRTLEALTDDERIAQLLMVGFDGVRVRDDLRELLERRHVGGVILYQQNIASPEQVRSLNTEILTLSSGGVPPFIAVDQEGGLVRRVRDGVPDLPGNMALGATRSADLARRAGYSLGVELRALGFTMNFAPVLDVATNPANTSLRTRSFSDDPNVVAGLGAAFIEGETAAGIVAVAKHFPGEGATAGDTHYSSTSLEADRPQLDARELVPFQAAIGAGVPAMMTSHIALPCITMDPSTPATLSREVLSGILRNDLGFDGLIITDELQMRSIRGKGDPGESAIQAIEAGADMIMVVWDHHDRERVYEALKQAYATGRLSKRRLNESLHRILTVKARVGQARAASSSARNDHALAEEIAAKSVTLWRCTADPLLPSTDQIAIFGADGAVRRRLASSRWMATPTRVDGEVLRKARALIRPDDTILAILGSDNDRLLIEKLRAEIPEARLVIVSLGSPREIARIANPTAVVFAYSSSRASQEAAARVLMNEAAATGELPVRIDEIHCRKAAGATNP